MVETMIWESDRLTLLDQTKLPTAIEWIPCTTYQRVISAIKKLEVRGAPAIGAAAGFAMVLAFDQCIAKATDSVWNPAFKQDYIRIKDELVSARPTAVNLAWAADLMLQFAEKTAQQTPKLSEMRSKLENLARQIYLSDIEKNKRMGDYGAAIMPEEAVILTHCNAGALATCGWGTALGVIRTAWLQKKVKMVYSDETRPLLQGSRLTAWELLQDAIPVTTITDNMAAWTMKTRGVNIVITGADRIAANGDSANKIGTYGIAIAAQKHGIPFYIAAPASTFDFSLANGSQIPIEERSADEVRSFLGAVSAPPNVSVYNPAFDITPAELIAGIITEHGILRKPYTESIQQLKSKVSREDPFIWKA